MRPGFAIGIARFGHDPGYAIGAPGLGLAAGLTDAHEAASWFVALSILVALALLLRLAVETPAPGTRVVPAPGPMRRRNLAGLRPGAAQPVTRG